MAAKKAACLFVKERKLLVDLHGRAAQLQNQPSILLQSQLQFWRILKKPGVHLYLEVVSEDLGQNWVKTKRDWDRRKVEQRTKIIDPKLMSNLIWNGYKWILLFQILTGCCAQTKCFCWLSFTNCVSCAELRELLPIAAIEHRFNVGLSENKGKTSETHFCGW